MANDASTRGALYPVMSTTSGDAGYTVAGATLTGATLTTPTISGSVQKRTVVTTGGAYATPIVLTAANSGSFYLLDTAAGLDFTLPAVGASDTGIHYTFFLTATRTSNNYRITAQAGDLLRGGVQMFDKDTATGDTNALISVFRPNESSHLVVTLATDATGDMIGGWIELTAITATGWFVRGSLIGDGSMTTPFS